MDVWSALPASGFTACERTSVRHWTGRHVRATGSEHATKKENNPYTCWEKKPDRIACRKLTDGWINDWMNEWISKKSRWGNGIRLIRDRSRRPRPEIYSWRGIYSACCWESPLGLSPLFSALAWRVHRPPFTDRLLEDVQVPSLRSSKIPLTDVCVPRWSIRTTGLPHLHPYSCVSHAGLSLSSVFSNLDFCRYSSNSSLCFPVIDF